MGGCTIGTDPYDYAEWYNAPPFSEAIGGLDYSIDSGVFHASGLVSVRDYQPVVRNSDEVWPYPNSTSSFTMSLDLAASSPGEIRPGLINLMFYGYVTPDPGGSGINLDLQVGSIFREVDLGGGFVSTFPFILGEPFIVHIGAWGAAGADGVHGAGDRQAYPLINFSLSELDGSPVQVRLYSVPEPSTLLLLAPMLPLLALKRRSSDKRARTSKPPPPFPGDAAMSCCTNFIARRRGLETPKKPFPG
jgi:hypothetical protein